MAVSDPRVAELVVAGAVRLALFLPQYAENGAAIRGAGTGFIAIEIARAIAERLGIAAPFAKYPSPKAAVAGLQGGACDMVFLGIEPSRTAVLDFTPPLFQFDYSLLVPSGSTIAGLEDADQPERRIGLVESHASALALRRMVKRCELVGVELPEDAFVLMRDGKVDALAFPRDQLLEFAERLPGARVLPNGYGINRVGMAVAQGRAGLLAYLSEFAEHAKASGLLQQIIDRGGLRGFDVAA